MTDSPMNSPRKYMCIPHNTPQVSPERYGMEHARESIHVDASVSNATDPPTFVSKEFQNELLQALFNKFPDKIKMENSPPRWWEASGNIPTISVSSDPDSKVPKYLGDSDAQLTIQNLESYNLMCMSNSMEKMEFDRSNSDQMSTMATCASDISDHDSLCSFEEEDISKRAKSVSLDESEYQKMKQSALKTELTVLKYHNKASSLDDIHDNTNSFIDFETTL